MAETSGRQAIEEKQKGAAPAIDVAPLLETEKPLVELVATALHANCLEPLVALLYLELHLLAVSEIVSLHFAIVHENVFLPVVGLDETKSSVRVELLYFTCRHNAMLYVVVVVLMYPITQTEAPDV